MCKKKGRFQRNRSGKRQKFIVPEQKFYLQLKLTDPKDTGKLINFPEGVQVRLMNNGSPLKNDGAINKTSAQGRVCLAPDTRTINSSPNYHFRIDLEERTYYDIDTKGLVKSADIKEDDDRNIMEFPMVIDTKSNGFYFDENKLQLSEGMLKNYDKNKKGEGTEGDPIVLEVRFYWYYLRYKYFDRILNDWHDVPRGMPVIHRLDVGEYFRRYITLSRNANTEKKKIQHYLNLLGFKCGKVDGRIWPLGPTKKAIREFKKAHRLAENSDRDLVTKRKIEQVFFRRRIGVWNKESKSYAIPVWKTLNQCKKVFFEIPFIPDDLRLLGDDEDAQKETAQCDLFVYTKDKDTKPKTMTRDEINKQENKNIYEDLPFLKGRHYYDLPTVWSSMNYRTGYDNDLQKGERYQKVMKASLELYPFCDDENKRADKNNPLIFSFDDIVLGKENRSQDIRDKNSDNAPMNLDKNSRYTLFYIDDTKASGGKYKEIVSYEKGKIKIYNQDVKEPVFTKGTFFKGTIGDNDVYTNLIYDIPKHVRIVYFCNDFYDVYNKRSQRSDPEFHYDKGHILGARLAVCNDPEVHKSRAIRGNKREDLERAYAAEDCGNFELHYFHNCSVLDDKPLAYLFIYWSCRFTLTDKKGEATGGRQAGVDKHREKGMTNAMKRLNKDYLLVPSEKHNAEEEHKVDIFIRPFHFMEAKNDTNGGKEKAIVNIRGRLSPMSDMGIIEANFVELSFADRHFLAFLAAKFFLAHISYKLFSPIKDTDGIDYKVLANHHEMGHATGCLDDYLYNYEFSEEKDGETVEKEFGGLPGFEQDATSEGGPYSCDYVGRMYYCRSPRLRNFWKYLCWLHDEAKQDGELYNFLKKTRFMITFKGKKDGAGFSHNFELDNEYKDINKPAKKKLFHEIANFAQTDLLLYKLGDDELSHFKNLGKLNDGYSDKQQFKGILVVKTKLVLIFIQGFNKLGRNVARSWSKKLNGDLKSMLNGKFAIENDNQDNPFSKIYIYFVPHFSIHKQDADLKEDTYVHDVDQANAEYEKTLADRDEVNAFDFQPKKAVAEDNYEKEEGRYKTALDHLKSISKEFRTVESDLGKKPDEPRKIVLELRKAKLDKQREEKISLLGELEKEKRDARKELNKYEDKYSNAGKVDEKKKDLEQIKPHFVFRIKRQKGSSIEQSEKYTKVNSGTNTKKLIRYCFGKNDNKTDDLVKEDFQWIAQWVNTLGIGDDFKIKDLD